MDKETKFKQIQSYFDNLDKKKEENEEQKVFDTEKGIFGTSSMQDIYDWLTQLAPEETTVFVDLGSGDGRIVCVASLFCKAIGIEFDQGLHDKAIQYAKELDINAEFLRQDYETYDFSNVNIIFCYADHDFSEELQNKLQEQFSGNLYIYQGTFFPSNAVKQKTTWVGQTPLMTYKFEK